MQQAEKTGPSILSRLVAVVVLAIAGFLLLKFLLGFVAWLATVVVVIVAVVAVVWALRVLF
jgi:uncharacterized membrane protein YgaE (UPF0421/DUF939 family)